MISLFCSVQCERVLNARGGVQCEEVEGESGTYTGGRFTG
jgi:hypothetical protein